MVWFNKILKLSLAQKLFFCAFIISNTVVGQPFFEALDDNATVLEGQTKFILPKINDLIPDPANTLIRITYTGNPDIGTAILKPNQPTSDTIVYTPNPDLFPLDGGKADSVRYDTIRYEIQDLGTELSGGEIFLEIRRVSKPPIAVSDTFYMDEDTREIFEFLNNDFDREEDELFIRVSSLSGTPPYPLHGDISAVDIPFTKVQYASDKDYFGVDSFYYETCETAQTGGSVCSDSVWVYVIINPVNDPPIPVNDTIDINEDELVCFDDTLFTGNDIDIDNDLTQDEFLLEEILNAHPDDSAVLVNGQVCYQAAPNYNGTRTLNYVVCDRDPLGKAGLCDTGLIVLNVVPVNDVPIAVDDTVEAVEDSLVCFLGLTSLILNDFDEELDEGQALFITQLLNVESGDTAYVRNDNEVCFQAELNFFGERIIEYKVCDDSGDTASCDIARVAINVAPRNDVPVAFDTTIYVQEYDSVCISVRSADVDNEVLTVVAFDPFAPDSGVTYEEGEFVCYRSDSNTVSDVFEYQVSDEVASDIGEITVFVLKNQAPIAMDDTVFFMQEGGPLDDILLNDVDPDSNNLFYEVIEGPSNGTITTDPVTGSIIYTPDFLSEGKDIIVYRVYDDAPISRSDTASVCIVVDPFLPTNSFTPNGDGVNDLLVFQGLWPAYPDNELIVFNRWGERVLNEVGYKNDWDGYLRNAKRDFLGDEVPDGTYFWVLKVSRDGLSRDFKGFVVLKR